MSATKGTLRILLVGGPMYDPLYSRLEEFKDRKEISVEVVAILAHPDLNARIEEEFSSGRASCDLISTHTKYAPS
jgi:multiple sugar transport system substrate-binding protein